MAFLVLWLDNLLQIRYRHLHPSPFPQTVQKDGQRENEASCLRPALVLVETRQTSFQILYQIMQPLPNPSKQHSYKEELLPYLQPPSPKYIWWSTRLVREDYCPTLSTMRAPWSPVRPEWCLASIYRVFAACRFSDTSSRLCCDWGFTLHFSP